jgi:hypothetical protein
MTVISAPIWGAEGIEIGPQAAQIGKRRGARPE